MEPWPELVRAEPKKDWDLQGAGSQELRFGHQEHGKSNSTCLSDPQMCKLHSKLSKDPHHSRAFTVCQALLEVLSVSQPTYCVPRALGGIIARTR